MNTVCTQEITTSVANDGCCPACSSQIQSMTAPPMPPANMKGLRTLNRSEITPATISAIAFAPRSSSRVRSPALR